MKKFGATLLLAVAITGASVAAPATAAPIGADSSSSATPFSIWPNSR